MNKASIRLVLLFGLVSIGSFGVHHFACDRPRAEESGPFFLPASVVEYLDGVLVSGDLQARIESNDRRLHAKQEVIVELVADRLTLLEAAARFAELDADVPGIRERLAQRYPGASAEVAWCHEVIERARSVLWARAPEQLEQVVARLGAELQAYEEQAGSPQP
jgi:hypothetical protein